MSYLHDMRTEFQGYSRNIRLFFLGNFLYQTGMAIYTIIYNLYIQALGYSNTVAGSIVSYQSLASALILIPIGMLSDRIGRKKILVIGGWLVAASFIFRAVIEQESSLLIFAFMTGIFSAFVVVPSIPLLAENSRIEQRAMLFSYNFAIVMVAQVLGNLVGGLSADLFQWLGLSTVLSYRITLLIGTALCLASLFPFQWIQEAHRTKTMVANLSILKGLRRIWEGERQPLKVIFYYGIVQLFIGLGAGLVFPYFNLYFHDRFAVDNWVIGLVAALGQAVTAVAMMMGPFLARRWGDVKMVVILQLSSVPFLLMTGFTTVLFWGILGYLFRQIFMNAGDPIKQSVFIGLVDDRHKGLANSVAQMVSMIGYAAMGPISMRIVVENGAYTGYLKVFVIASFLYVMGSILFYFAFNKRVQGAAKVKA
ncbi:MFS transporter [Rubeoparvulum massiliense]|uniref:MFS transporter n=1 Tax=Rubeoparvulum massiliense TaxID=1631346 RepID=UPI00065DD3B5|nr:MFS transporter [Rubeoparvulum massiliense]